MKKLLIISLSGLLLGSACGPKQSEYSISGHIRNGATKYLKIIDMTRSGLAPDSIELDMEGKFNFIKTTNQPGDYIVYFKPSDYLRITPLPNENVVLKGDYNNLLYSTEIAGSNESQQVNLLLKKHQKAVHIIDTLNRFYMNNQLNPLIDSIINQLKFISDSVYQSEKTALENYINENPASIASYIALSLKLGHNTPIFTLENDLSVFELVDSSLYLRFDTIDMVKMLHAFVLQGKVRAKNNTQTITQLPIGSIAPSIDLPNSKGDTLQLSELSGKYILVDFWGSWCRPCRKENANLVIAYQKYYKAGFEIYQVALERNITDWMNTLREDKLTWKYQVVDLKYMNSDIARNYKIKALPSNYLVSPEGVIIAQNIYGTQLTQKLEEIFATKTKPVQPHVQ